MQKNKMNFVTYYRISTTNDTKVNGKKAKKSGQTGLGLLAQQTACLHYINSVQGVLLQEFKEYESAMNKERITLRSSVNLDTLLNKRPVLIAALEFAKAKGAILLVKEVSRLTRNKLLGEYLMAAGVDFKCSDYANDDNFMISLKINIEHSNGLKISERTSLALQEKMKRDGKWQVTPQAILNGSATKKSVKSRRDATLTNENNIRAVSVIKMLRGEKNSYSIIADHLNKHKYKTSTGGEFTSTQVHRLEKIFKTS